MSDNEIELLERYILAPEKEKFFSSLIHNSDTFNRLRLLDHLNRYGTDLPPDSRAQLEKALRDPPRFNTYACFLYLLLCIEGEADASRRASLMAEFNQKYLKVSFSIPRPSALDNSTRWLVDKEPSHPSVIACDGHSFVEYEKGLFAQQGVSVRDILKQYYYRFDLQQLLGAAQLDLGDFRLILDSLPSFAHVPSIGVVLLEYDSKAKRRHKSGAFSFVIPTSYYEKMTLRQLDEVQEALPHVVYDRNFVVSKFRKAFETELFGIGALEAVYTPEDLERRCHALRKMYAWVHALPQTQSYLSFASQILRTLLVLDLRRNTVEEALFKEYLSNPLRFDWVVYGVRETIHSDDGAGERGPSKVDMFWYDVHRLDPHEWIDEKKFVTEILLKLFMEGAGHGSYSVYFDRGFLQTQYCTAQILAGKQVENAAEHIEEPALSALLNRKHLLLARWNRVSFQPGENVVLYLEVKNINSVSVNIFEIDTESYYRKNLAEISEHVNLIGLIPNRSFERALENDPAVLQTVAFESLFVPKRGVYVVDFVGDGLSSRALIRVGALTVVTQVLSKGILLHMVDEQKRVCHSEGTAIVVSNRVLKTDEALDHGILVPFREESAIEKVVLLHEGFAELYTLHIPREEATLTCGLLFNEETVKRSGHVEIMLLPKLMVNNLHVGLTSLKRINVVVTATSTAGVNSLTAYEDVVVNKGKKSIVLEYFMKAKTERLVAQMTARFFSTAQGKCIDLSCEESVRVNRFIGKNLFYDLYLSPSGDRDLKLHFLGKDGEPYAQKTVRVGLQSIYLAPKEDEWETLQTNAEGEILLTGAIPHISNLKAEMLNAPDTIKRNIDCDLSNADRITSLRRVHEVLENSELCFPAASQQFIASEYELVKVSKDDFSRIISDHKVQLVYKDGMVHLTDLQEGVYRFTYRDHGVALWVTVHAGKRWPPAPHLYVEKKNCIVKISDQAPPLSYKNFSVHDGCVEFCVVASDIRAVEVHALAFTYFPKTLPAIKRMLRRLQTDEKGEAHEIRGNACIYMSEKRLSDEAMYVLERRRKRNAFGCTLEKPPALLKRHFVREAHEDEEFLQEGEGYRDTVKASKTLGVLPHNMLRSLAMHPRGAEEVITAKLHAAGTSSEPISDTYVVDHLSTFLSTVGWSHFGIAPNPTDGRVCIEVPQDQGFSTLLFVLRDRKSSVVWWAPLPVGARPSFRDVRLSKSKEAGVVYVQERQARGLEKGNVVEIPDSDVSDSNVVDDVATLFKVLRLVNPDPALKEWEFLTRWHTMSPEEQLKKYDKYACHELNLFTYFRDPEFFVSVVSPHVRCKSKKQFIDYFLLGEAELLTAYLSPARLELLNVLEKALLVRFFSERKSSESQAIALDIAHYVETLAPDQKYFEHIFDTIVTGGTACGGEHVRSPDLLNFQSASYAPSGVENNAPSGVPFVTYNNLLCEAVNNSAVALSANSVNRELSLKTESYEGVLDGAEDELAARVVKYRSVGATNEYVEKQYFRGDTFDAEPNAFWVDVLKHFASSAHSSFLTQNFMVATRNLTEMLLVLALIDLPLKKDLHPSGSSPQRQKHILASNAIVFTKTIQKKSNEESHFDLLMTQKFCDPGDLYNYFPDNTRSLKNVLEFISGKLYMSKVVLTNASESSLSVSVVHEVPQGAIPVASSEYTQYINLDLEPLSTQLLEFFFYFPQTGEFTCYPATVSKGGCFISKADITTTFKVFRSRTIVKKDTLSNVLSNGSKADILLFMENNNLHRADRFQLDAIYCLLSDKQFYTDVLSLLRRKHAFDEKVWSFSIKHGDYLTFSEYLQNHIIKHGFMLSAADAIGGPLLYLSTKTLQVDRYEYKEYYPLVVSRAHEVGAFRHNIRCREFRESYKRFLQYLSQKSPHLTSKDYIYLCTYFLLQGRLDDGVSVYPKILQARAKGRGGEVQEELQIQFDYLTAYLDQYTDYPAFRRARELCARYLAYPVCTWRDRFAELLSQISAVDGGAGDLPGRGAAPTADRLNRGQADAEPHLSAELRPHERSIRLVACNNRKCTLSFYRIDLEELFSQDPFLSTDSIDYSYVRPNAVHTQLLPEPYQVMATEVVPIPSDLGGCNLIIQVKAGSHVVNLTYFPKAMEVIVNRNYGLVKVVADGSHKPLSGVYVKAFAKKTDGTVFFYRDGYTDLCGFFEYASAHANRLDELEEFSLLILSAEFGGRVERTCPPSTVAAMDLDASRIVSGTMQSAYRKKVKDSSNKYCI